MNGIVVRQRLCRWPAGKTMSETLTETFARFAEDAEFRRWSEGRTLGFRFVYARQEEGTWRFTAEEWWRFVTRTIRKNGAYNLPTSKQIQSRPKKIDGVETVESSSCDNTSRSVNLVHWTMADWKNELDAMCHNNAQAALFS